MDKIFIAIALIMAAFFAGSETIFLTANKLRIEVLFRRKVKGIKKVYSFIRKPETFLVTSLVGTNLFQVIFSSLTVLLLKDSVDEFLIVVLATTILLVFSEIVPKAIASEFSNHLIIGTARILRIFKIIFFPINVLLTTTSNLLLKLFDLPTEQNVEEVLTRKSIQLAILESERSGIIKSKEGKIINRLFDLRKTRIKDPMIPRTDIVAVKKNTSIKKLLKVFKESGFSRIPVYDKNIDNIIGVVHAKDIFKKPKKIQDIMQKILFVPETKYAFELLKEFRKTKTSIAVVLDEYGGTAGLVTLEDLVEELIGEIYDEFDIEHKHLYKKLNAFTIRIDAKAEIDEINEKFGLSIPEDEAYSTLGGFIIEQLGHIPKAGEVLELERCKIVIEKASRKRVISVKIILKNPMKQNDE